MSSSADVNVPTTRSVPVYKRKRRRLYGIIAVVAIVVIALIVWAVTQGGSSGPATLPSFTIAVSQGTVASPDSVILSQPSLEKIIPAHVHTVPFDAVSPPSPR